MGQRQADRRTDARPLLYVFRYGLDQHREWSVIVIFGEGGKCPGRGKFPTFWPPAVFARIPAQPQWRLDSWLWRKLSDDVDVSLFLSLGVAERPASTVTSD